MPASLDDKLDAIARHPFRAKFHLRGRDRATAQLRGPSTMRLHARDLVAKRLAPAEPRNDGKQTPYRGHPVFVAQHATATFGALASDPQGPRTQPRADRLCGGRDLPLDRTRSGGSGRAADPELGLGGRR
jgi:hypothetical protein